MKRLRIASSIKLSLLDLRIKRQSRNTSLDEKDTRDLIDSRLLLKSFMTILENAIPSKPLRILPRRVSMRRFPSRNTAICALLTVFCCHDWKSSLVTSFSIAPIHLPVRTFTTSPLQYGRNMEIWPQVGVNDAIRIQDSFPNGIVPAKDDAVSSERRGWRYRVQWWLQQKLAVTPLNPVDSSESFMSLFIHVMIWVATMQTGAVRRMDLLGVGVLTGYLLLLTRWAASTPDQFAPLSKGPVPYTVQYPLGYQMTMSRVYHNWKRLGRGLDYGIPAALLLVSRVSITSSTMMDPFTSWMTRILFLSSCQGITEYLSDRTLMGVRCVPLPIRGLIPIMYSFVRLLYMWQWVFTVTRFQPSVVSIVANVDWGWKFLRVFPMVHMLYCVIHLFGFLLPVALIRYLRVYFYMVEAQEVHLRATNSPLV